MSDQMIFIVDDDPMVRRALVRLLGSVCEVHAFDNAHAALAMLDELRPAVVISDNSMPGIDGFDFLRKVRAEHPRMRTVMLTGDVISERILDSVANREIDVRFQKPWDNDELRALICELLGQR